MSNATRLGKYAKSHFTIEELQEKKDYFLFMLETMDLNPRHKAFILERLETCNYLLEEKGN
jgi:hypothetical protein